MKSGKVYAKEISYPPLLARCAATDLVIEACLFAWFRSFEYSEIAFSNEMAGNGGDSEGNTQL